MTSREVRVEKISSSMLGTWWSLYRVADGKLEASGFGSAAEAAEWASEHGWTVVESEIANRPGFGEGL